MERAAGGQWHWASSFKFGSCKRSPSAAQAAAGKTENRAGQGSRATASYTSQTPDRKEGTQHAARDSAGFQVPATRSQCASGPGSEPGIAVARTQHRVRAAAGCVHNGRPGNWSRTCQSAAVQGSSFTGAGISGAPGQRAPGADTSSYNSERSCATDISHNGGPPEYQLDVVSSVSSAGRENTEGGCGPAGRRAHRYCFVFICQRQRPPKTEAPA